MPIIEIIKIILIHIALFGIYFFGIKKRISVFKLTIINAFLLFIIIIFIEYYEQKILINSLEKFDLNKDGFYNNVEINEEFIKIENEIISDSGSRLFILYGFPVCLIYSIFITFLYKLILFINEIFSKNIK